MDILSNAVVVSVLVMVVLCVFRFNVLLSILVAALCAGLFSHDLLQDSGDTEFLAVDFFYNFLNSIVTTSNILIGGMSKNLNVALSYILLGAIAIAIANTNIMHAMIHTVARGISNNNIVFILSIAFFACFSQNLIPVHIAFIPILIPPLLHLMNKLQIDRRAVACALTFGLQAPYITFGFCFGLIFHTVIRDQMLANGVEISLSDIAGVMWIGGLAMLVGLLLATFVFYRKPRIYRASIKQSLATTNMGWREYAVLFGIIVTFVVQLLTDSLALGALIGLLSMIALGGIKWGEIDLIMEGGLKMMAFIAFVMLVAAGYGEVLRESGEVQSLVSLMFGMVDSKLTGIIFMLLIGLLITMGIGTSFGTVPIIAAVYVPLGTSLGISTESMILLIGIAGALGDAGSPASDSTLGPTSGLNADNQHNHISDTCIPTFLMYNTSLLLFGVVGAMIL
ncbi:Na+/H+ antiporter NhaC family protein [Helicobacter muridarum]|uniref:Putative Na+/H+ antiporter n=1 Tax=Helicobacter muridarum TaxID=216 RepID=A0A377PR52_9HELI|nr:Na+/H+ antiporter NhaC family protein [Helicobacter muridarum]STQ85296.1 putative Na+/H+ antiporter [Helicobacter muridarum]